MSLPKTTHTCLECGQSFEGRKNQQYCNLTCKTNHNNRKGREKYPRVALLQARPEVPVLLSPQEIPAMIQLIKESVLAHLYGTASSFSHETLATAGYPSPLPDREEQIGRYRLHKGKFDLKYQIDRLG